MKFTKLHGCGNDYVYMDCINNPEPTNPEELSKEISERRFGIGSDGLILILPSKKADFRMRIFNSDGSEAEMCGNGVRGFAKYLYDRKITTKKEFTVETLRGIIKPQIFKVDKSGKAELIRVDMGEPILEREKIPMLGKQGTVINEQLHLKDQIVRVTAVSMGNPHCIIFVDTMDYPVEQVGKEIESHNVFPKKTNVEFIQVLNKNEVNMRVWERGSGETLACGTGASASVVACVLNKRTERNVKVHLKGGDLEIEWDEDTNHVFMTGPAVEVYSGEFDIK